MSLLGLLFYVSAAVVYFAVAATLFGWVRFVRKGRRRRAPGED